MSINFLYLYGVSEKLRGLLKADTEYYQLSALNTYVQITL